MHTLVPFERIYTLILLITGFCTGCDPPQSPDPSGQPVPDNYPEPIATIFADHRCLECHNDTRSDAGLNLARWSALFEGSAFGAVVMPGSVEWSHLLWHVNTYPEEGLMAQPWMPPLKQDGAWTLDSANRLSRSDLQTLKRWIVEGAPAADGGLPWAEAETRNHGKYFFLNSGNDLMGVMDLEHRLVMRYIPVGKSQAIESPHFITASPDQAYVYLTLIEGGRVEKYRTDQYQLAARSPDLGPQPAHVKASGDGRWVLVTHWQRGGVQLSLLDAETLDIADQLTGDLLDRPHGLAITRDFTRAWVTASEGNYVAEVRIDPERGKFEGSPRKLSLEPGMQPRTSLAIQPYQALLSPDETRLYVTAEGTHEVHAIDVSSARPVWLGKAESDGETNPCSQGVGKRPKLMTQVGDQLFVVCAGETCRTSANRSRSGCISVIDVSSDVPRWQSNIYGVGQRPHGINVAGTTLYITNENQGAGQEEAHHFVPGLSSSEIQGNLNFVDIRTQEVLRTTPMDVAIYPTGGVIIPKPGQFGK